MVKIQYNYSKLLGKIKERGYTQVLLASKMGISETTLNLSLGNKRAFKQDEIIAACSILDIPLCEVDNYFFCHKSLEN